MYPGRATSATGGLPRPPSSPAAATLASRPPTSSATASTARYRRVGNATGSAGRLGSVLFGGGGGGGATPMQRAMTASSSASSAARPWTATSINGGGSVGVAVQDANLSSMFGGVAPPPSAAMRLPKFAEHSSVKHVAAALAGLPARTLIEAVMTVLLENPPSLIQSPITMLMEEYQRQLSRRTFARFSKGGVVPSAPHGSQQQENDDDDGSGSGGAKARRGQGPAGSSLFEQIVSVGASKKNKKRRHNDGEDDQDDDDDDEEEDEDDDAAVSEPDWRQQAGGSRGGGATAVVVDNTTAVALCVRPKSKNSAAETRDWMQTALPALPKGRRGASAEDAYCNENDVDDGDVRRLADVKMRVAADAEFQRLHAQLVEATSETLRSRAVIAKLQRKTLKLSAALAAAETAAMSALHAAASGGGGGGGGGGGAAAAIAAASRGGIGHFRAGAAAVLAATPALGRRGKRRGGDSSHVDDDELVDVGGALNDEDAAILAQEQAETNRALANLRGGGGGGATVEHAGTTKHLRTATGGGLSSALAQPQQPQQQHALVLENGALKQLVTQLRSRIGELEAAMNLDAYFCEHQLQRKMLDVTRDNEYLIAVSTSLANALMERGGKGAAESSDFDVDDDDA